MRIYAVFARFLSVSLLSFLIDIGLFALMYSTLESVFASTYAARAISASFNFMCNKYLVFKALNRRDMLREMFGYFLLAAFVASLSATLVEFSQTLNDSSVVLSKIGIDALIFFVSFLAQNFILFSTAAKKA